MNWVVKAQRKKLDEQLNLIDSDLEVYYSDQSKFISWLIYKWLTSWHCYSTVMRTNVPGVLEEQEHDA